MNFKIDLINRVLCYLILIELLLKLVLIFNLKIGWDEFGFLSRIHDYQRGELTQLFQTFHVHILGWVSSVSSNEVSQIIAGRYFFSLLFIVSGILFYSIARNFIDKTGAIFSVFCWVSFSNVIYHGSSLRYDTVCSFLYLLSAFALLKNNREYFWATIAGIASGLSILISIKASIHVASLFVFLFFLFNTTARNGVVFRKTASFIILMAITIGIGLTLHKYLLNSNISQHQQGFFSNAAAKAIVTDGFFSRYYFFKESLMQNLVIWWIMFVGILFALLDIWNKRDKNLILAFSFLVPLLSIPFYRNAFPYYYVFVIAPAFLFCGILPQRIIQVFLKNRPEKSSALLALMILVITIGAGVHYVNAFKKDNKSQKELIGVIHRMFPLPVPYIDGCSAVSSFPKEGFFMSTWGFENYLSNGKPIFRRILEEEHPQFILADTPHLDFSLQRDLAFFKYNYDFLPEDLEILKGNYINFWGMIWLPGKVLSPEKTGEMHEFEILIPGPYITESGEPIIIDNELRLPGSKVTLTTGKHTYQQIKNNNNAVLRWNNVSFLPQKDPPEISSFYGF